MEGGEVGVGAGGGRGLVMITMLLKQGGRLEPLQGQSVGADCDVDRCIHWLSTPQLIVTFHFSGHWGGEIACIYIYNTDLAWLFTFSDCQGHGGAGGMGVTPSRQLRSSTDT